MLGCVGAVCRGCGVSWVRCVWVCRGVGVLDGEARWNTSMDMQSLLTARWLMSMDSNTRANIIDCNTCRSIIPDVPGRY